MADLSKEWCLERAERKIAFAGKLDAVQEQSPLLLGAIEDNLMIAQALRIAARALDEGAVERLAGVIDEIVDARTSYNEEAYIRNTDEVSQAVINYLLEGKE